MTTNPENLPYIDQVEILSRYVTVEVCRAEDEDEATDWAVEECSIVCREDWLYTLPVSGTSTDFRVVFEA